ncbi:ceramidase [Mrakia frigida]|uniref:ceramidase n=1 Tax=Mrakia frigida TaxID=29902 RepID=UPI003FCC1A3B
MSLPSARPGQPQSGYFGNHTASIDWCEQNYEITPYIAEFINTTSNLPTAALALYGIYSARKERLPMRVTINFAGILIIAAGSLWFHSTMSHFGQLSDELPMIFTTSLLVWSACETSPGYDNFNLISPLSVSLMMFNVLITVSCLLGLSPTLHQIGFGLLVTAATARVLYLLHVDGRCPPSSPARAGGVKLFERGVASFLTSFAIWNVDNLSCENYLTPLKKQIGLPFAFVLELHSYWHLGTGLAAFLAITGASCICLSIKDPQAGYHIEHGFLGLPFVARGRGDAQNGHGLILQEVSEEKKRI